MELLSIMLNILLFNDLDVQEDNELSSMMPR